MFRARRSAIIKYATVQLYHAYSLLIGYHLAQIYFLDTVSPPPPPNFSIWGRQNFRPPQTLHQVSATGKMYTADVRVKEFKNKLDKLKNTKIHGTLHELSPPSPICFTRSGDLWMHGVATPGKFVGK